MIQEEIIFPCGRLSLEPNAWWLLIICFHSSWFFILVFDSFYSLATGCRISWLKIEWFCLCCIEISLWIVEDRLIPLSGLGSKVLLEVGCFGIHKCLSKLVLILSMEGFWIANLILWHWKISSMAIFLWHWIFPPGHQNIMICDSWVICLSLVCLW